MAFNLASPLHQNCQAHPSAPMALLLTRHAKSSMCSIHHRRLRSLVLPPAPPASQHVPLSAVAPNLPYKPP
ncbi:hypothetical protein M0R45_027295 [Rubus argutus]|uniref:Uncharacterized protein n=1 Tax=Rubus argutus TaxID=59490 RepID=A0AAW1X0T9_RUBAR